ncbi:hypothetical protein SOPP22_10135 [Shewanella sp. OPT22]|nr:hypothetical protein SOPP22_10135 [Shewanella sp. OPT22]
MLAEFLEKLGQDTELLAAYKKDPRGVMKKHGVADDEIEAIMTKDEKKLEKISKTSSSGVKMLYIATGEEL